MSTTAATLTWENKRTNETRSVEEVLKNAGFERVDAYRYNSAVIRLRVIDHRFEKVSRDKRDELIEPFLEKLPTDTQTDIITLLALAPSELHASSKNLRENMLNAEFEDPSPSIL